MKSILSYALAAAAILPSCLAFSTPSLSAVRRDVSLDLHNNNNIENNDEDAQLSDRRSALSTFAALPLGILATTSTVISPSPANAEGNGKVVVFGGSGKFSRYSYIELVHMNVHVYTNKNTDTICI